jgi:hypothetical protein
MDQCRHCEKSGGEHQPGCPEEKFPYADKTVPMSDETKRLRMAEWRSGYDDGRAGQPSRTLSPSYSFGWRQGDSAADDAANG